MGNATNTIWSFKPPGNFSINLDGYTCTEAFRTDATKLSDPSNPGSLRKTQVRRQAVVQKQGALLWQISLNPTPSGATWVHEQRTAIGGN